MLRFTMLGLTILLAFAPVALAVDGVVLINQSTITNGLPNCPTGGLFPIVICQSGSYRLSGNLTVPDANTTAIQVEALDVTIDLNGFAIQGPGTTGSGVGISGAENTSVLNGTVRGMGSTGITLFAGRAYKIQTIANGGDGIDGNIGSLVSECNSRGNGGRGLRVVGTAINNSVSDNRGDGIVGGPGVITGNAVNGNSGNGIVAQDAVISGNSVTFNSKAGILATCAVNIIGNDVSSNFTGIVTSGFFCLVVNNNP